MRFVDSVIIFSIVCPFCGKEHSVKVSEHSFDEWQSGALIQNAMPTLSATEREQIISHICPTCQDRLFGATPEEIEDDDVEEDVDACMRESLEFTGQWW